MNDFLSPWYEALAEPIGWIIETNNPKLCKQRLYRARAEAKDNQLAGLSIVDHPNEPHQLLIIKARPDAQSDTEETHLSSV